MCYFGDGIKENLQERVFDVYGIVEVKRELHDKNNGLKRFDKLQISEMLFLDVLDVNDEMVFLVCVDGVFNGWRTDFGCMCQDVVDHVKSVISVDFDEIDFGTYDTNIGTGFSVILNMLPLYEDDNENDKMTIEKINNFFEKPLDIQLVM